MAVGYRDYYDLLGVDRDADPDEIRRAYRKLAREFHPDINKNDGAEDRFKEISEAYEVLRDPEKRARYDRLGANWRSGQDVSGAADFGGFGAGRGDFTSGDFASGDFSEFFENLFGGRARRGGPAGGFGMPMRGADREATLELSLDEAARGGKRHLSFADGQSYDVDIPRGVRDGQRIRLAGEGGAGADGGPSGDLFLRVRIAPHRHFRLDGDDLHVDVAVSPSEAALGARVPVRTLTGTAQVRVPAGSSSGRRLRLRGEGMPNGRGAPGDLYAHLQIKVPKTLDPAVRELYEQLAATGFDPREATG